MEIRYVAAWDNTYSHHCLPPNCQWDSGTFTQAAQEASPHPDCRTDMLHLALLDIRTTVKEDLKCTTVELVYDTILRLLGEFLVQQDVADSAMQLDLKTT